MTDPVLRAENVRKSFGEDTVLDGVDLSVDSGELVVLMGANGVGKSVLLSCLAGSEQLSTGTVKIDGESVSERNGSASLLVQDSLCLDRLSGRENIAFYKRVDPRFTDRWQQYIDRFDLEEDLVKSVEDYSGGMKRKLELAVSLSVDAPVYLLDEPTAALDLTAIKDVHALLKDHQDSSATFVVATHLPMDADIADRIAVLNNGQIVGNDSPKALMKSLPTVIEVDTGDTNKLRKVVVDGQLFQVNNMMRGFLPFEADEPDTIDSARTVQPTYTDLVNYYTQVVTP